MSLASFAQLFQHADAARPLVPIAVAGAADVTVLEAVRIAHDRGWIAPRLVGSEAEIRKQADLAGVSLSGLTVTDAADVAGAAVALVRGRQADLLMKGQIATPALMKAVLDPALGLRTERVIGQVVLMELCRTERRFLLLDTGICIQPTVVQKADLLRSAVDVARRLGSECPRVACMAATESTSPAMPETLDAAELQRLNQTGEIPGCVVRGPLSFDLAFDTDAAAKKRLSDPSFGVADIMLFPNLLSANLTVKAIMYTADCRFGGMLCGAVCPVVFMSRADTTATRLNSLALALGSLGGIR
jgi:phosphotransacetylase